MKYILMASGFPSYTLERLREYWLVTDIPRQQEALEYLRTAPEKPAVIVIGMVGAAPEGELTAREILKEIQKEAPHIPVIVSTSAKEINDIVDLVQRGAFDYVYEPHNNDEPRGIVDFTEQIILSLSRAVEYSILLEENRALRSQTGNDDGQIMLGNSSAIAQIRALAAKVAPTSATMLITGETGTGKEVIARYIHANSATPEAPFIPVNCGAMSETLLASELFGHEKGAFTGASIRKDGLIREAEGGTLFLDEIGTIPFSFQVMLLRVLENHTARPVGGAKEYKINCRFLAAANRDLSAMMQAGEFREDLLYRLNMFHIEVPPLRQRVEDIPVLVMHLLARVAQEHGLPEYRISPAALKVLEEYDWPGNVRQLRNVIERAMILCDAEVIEPFHLYLPSRPNGGDGLFWREGMTYESYMEKAERQLLKGALTAAEGNCSKAARMLGMKRTTLAHRLKKMDITSQNPAR